MCTVDPTSYQCTICMQGDANDDAVLFQALRQDTIDSGTPVLGDFISVAGDGRQYLSEVCEDGHMLCWDCHNKWALQSTKCPLCRNTMKDASASRKLEVYRDHAAAAELEPAPKPIPACLLPGRIELLMLVNGSGNLAPKAFMPLAVCFPAAVSVVLQNNNSMTVAAFLWRLSQNMGDDTHPVVSTRTDPAHWRLFVKTPSVRYPGQNVVMVHKLIPSDFVLLDIPKCIFDYHKQTLVLSMTPEYEHARDFVERGEATLEYLLQSGQDTLLWMTQGICNRRMIA